MNSYKPSNRDSIFLQSLNPLHLYTNLSQTPKPHSQETPNNHRAQILKEETKIEREIIKAVTAGKLDSLRPNSGQSVPIGEHYVCVSSHEEPDSDCRVWEWHGHVVFYDEENGFAQEYVYGNYFERTMRKVFGDESDEESEERSLGLGDLVAAMSLSDWPPPFSRKMGANYCRLLPPGLGHKVVTHSISCLTSCIRSHTQCGGGYDTKMRQTSARTGRNLRRNVQTRKKKIMQSR